MIWGLYNGLLLVFEKILNISEHSSNKTKIIKLFCTFNLICIGWIFFRANNFTQALHIITSILNFSHSLDILLDYSMELFISLNGILIILIFDFLFEHKKSSIRNYYKTPIILRGALFTAGVVFIMIFSATTSSSFIYFQF